MDQLRGWCARWRVAELALFGSALRDDFSAASDIDLLVTFLDGTVWDFDDLDAMTLEAEGILGRRVDLVNARTLRNPIIRADIFATRRVLYAA